MLSANINLAMLCLDCSAQALAQAGCNWNCPKKHGLTLAMQLFSSNSAAHFHQQVHFCSARMSIKPLSMQSDTTAELILHIVVFGFCLPAWGSHSKLKAREKKNSHLSLASTSIQLYLQNPLCTWWCVHSLSLRLRETEQEHQLIHLALSPHKQENVILAPASSPTLGSVEAPCCSVNKLLVAMPAGGKSTFLLWSAHSVLQKE